MTVADTLARTASSTPLRVGFGLVGAVFLCVAFVRTWDASTATLLPSSPSAGAAGGLMLLGIAAAGRSWTALFGSRAAGRSLAGAFYASQMGKYIPGGIWQPIGQIGLSTGPDLAAARAATVVPVHLAVQLAAGACLGATIGLVAPDSPAWARGLALAGFAAVLLLDRRLLARLAARISRNVRRAADVPGQREILRSFGWSLACMVCSSAAFAVLLESVAGTDGLVRAGLAFALAWAAGFAAVPFPSGIGVREAVLAAWLSSGAAAVIAASLAHRLIQIAGEALAIGLTWRAAR